MQDRDTGLVLAAIAEDAGRLVLPMWRSGLAIEHKADESPVTAADRAAERLILGRLAQDFPDVPVISEEDASEFGTPEAIGPRFFLVDPLDGTKAFVREDPNFTVNIALIENGRPIAGAVCAPASGETWFTREAGAWKRSWDASEARPIAVRRWPDEPVALISHTMKPEALDELRSRYGFAKTQAMDSSIKLVRIAEGAADIYPRHGPTMEWDIAAGHAVLAAAGGRLNEPDGAAFGYGKADSGFRNGWFVARGAD